MQLGRVRWANAELLARQAKDAMRRLKLTTLKLRLTRVKAKTFKIEKIEKLTLWTFFRVPPHWPAVGLSAGTCPRPNLLFEGIQSDHDEIQRNTTLFSCSCSKSHRTNI